MKIPGTRARPEPTELEVQLPMMQIPLAGVGVKVADREGGGKALVVGPVAIVFVLPLDVDVAKRIGGQLAAGIEIPAGSIVEQVARHGRSE